MKKLPAPPIRKRKRGRKPPPGWLSGYESPPDVYTPRLNGVVGEPLELPLSQEWGLNK